MVFFYIIMKNKNQKPTEIFNVWDDILKFHKMTQEEFDKWCEGLRTHEVGTRQREMIIAAYNGRQLDDPLPEYGPNTGVKYTPWFDMTSPSGSGFAYVDFDYWWSVSFVGARLEFFGDDAYDNMLDACKKFAEYFDKSMRH